MLQAYTCTERSLLRIHFNFTILTQITLREGWIGVYAEFWATN